jgi:hypothetical protein
MSQFFKRFPVVDYTFGEETSTNRFQNISTYIDLFDQVKDGVPFYEVYNILDYDRPDTLSYKLYGTTAYHWTFFLLNDHLREGGWPVTNMETFTLAQEYYPHVTIVTEDPISTTFYVGTEVTSTSSGLTGTIIERNLDLGQLVICTGACPDGTDPQFVDGEQLQYFDPLIDGTRSLTIMSQSPQYLAAHHYEDADGNIIDIDPYDQSNLTASKITELERLQDRNNELKQIRVLKSSAIDSIVGEYMSLLGSGQ